MTIPYWPSDLPQHVMRQGFSLGFSDGRLSTAMEKAPPKTRRRTSGAIKPIEAAITVSIDGVARFERFWESETSYGSLPFLMPDQIRHGIVLTDENGTPLMAGDTVLLNSAWWLALFGKDAPSAVNTAGAWYRVTFSLSVMP